MTDILNPALPYFGLIFIGFMSGDAAVRAEAPPVIAVKLLVHR
jgi:hypothetical protein